MSGDVSDDLIPQLLEKANWRNDVHSDLHRKAATALEAKEAEIAALRERVKELEGNTPKFQRDGDSYLICEGHHHVDEPCDFERYVPEARAETAERRVAELEASALAVENAKLKQWIELHRGDTLSLSNEVDHFREELAEAERKLAEARAALKNVKAAILEADIGVVTDTLWLPARISPNETAVDHIDIALGDQP